MAKLFGTKGFDVIQGSIFKDQIYGKAGGDYLYGHEGNDWIYGNDGDDHLFGNENNDHLYGGEGSDDLVGGAGNDYLDGGTGFDYLYGEAGNDVLIGHGLFSGGLGKDIMTGSAEQDFFVFREILESRPGLLTRDVITNFDKNDIINLLRVDADPSTASDDEFAFIGQDEAFTAVGQLKFDPLTFSLVANTNSNYATIEFAVKLTGFADIAATNLVL